MFNFTYSQNKRFFTVVFLSEHYRDYIFRLCLLADHPTQQTCLLKSLGKEGLMDQKI